MLTTAITFDAALLLMFLSWTSGCTLLVIASGVFYRPNVLALCLKEVTILQVNCLFCFSQTMIVN